MPRRAAAGRDPSPAPRFPSWSFTVKKRKPQRTLNTSPIPVTTAAGLRGRGVESLWFVAAALTFWSFGYTVMRGSDLWWHVAAGRWMIGHRSWPAVDPWSFSRFGQPWLHHEWLSDVLYSVWVDTFGLASLAWWKWGVIAATFLLLYRTLRRAECTAAAAYLASLAAVAVSAPFLDVRPHLYSLLGFAVLLRVVWVRPRRPWPLPALFLVWANLHGGFFFGLLALAAILAPDLLWGDRRERTAALAVPPLCALAALINPNGWEAFAYPLKYAADPDSPFRSIREWHPPWLPGGIEAPLFWPAMAVFVLAAAIWLARGGPSRRDRLGVGALMLGALTLAMALRSRRFIPLFAISQALLVAPLLSSGLALLRDRWPRFIAAWAAPTAFALLALLRLAPFPQSGVAFAYLTHEDSFPVDTLDFVEVNGLRGNVFAYYNWGGYLHLRTQGELRVYIDGRADTVFDAATYLRYTDVLAMAPGWRRVVDDSDAQYFLWPVDKGEQLTELSRDGSWIPIYRDAVSVLLARAGSVPAARSPPPDSAYRLLSLGAQLLQTAPWPCSDASCLAQLERAEGFLRRSFEREPTLGAACSNLARARAALGRIDEARVTMRECEAIYPLRRRRQAFEALIEELRSNAAGGSPSAGFTSRGVG